MADLEQSFDYFEAQIPSLSAAAVAVAYWQALACGQRVLIRANDGIYAVAADGTRTLVKPAPAHANCRRHAGLHSMTSPRLRIFAGPNGTGKSIIKHVEPLSLVGR